MPVESANSEAESDATHSQSLIQNDSLENQSSSEGVRAEPTRENILSGKRKRYRRWMIVSLLLGLVFGPYLFYRGTSFFTRVSVERLPEISQASPFEPSTQTLKVVAYNIAHGRGTAQSNWAESGSPKIQRVIEIGEMLKKLNADIIVLNEVDFDVHWSGNVNQAKLIAEQAGFPFVAFQSNLDFGFLIGRWKFGNAILSKFPISQVRVIELPAHKEWEDWLVGKKRSLHCTIELNSETSIDVLGVHLEYRSEDTRFIGVKALKKHIDQYVKHPLLVAGDLNTTPTDAPQANKTTDGQNAFNELLWISALQPFQERVEDQSQLTFPSWNPSTAIDWILFEPSHFEMTAMQIKKSNLSDHLPIIAELKLHATQPANQPEKD